MKRICSTRNFILSAIALIAIIFFTGCSKSGASSNPTPSFAITSLSVNSGPYNITVIITGVGFSNTIANNQAFFNGKAATITAATTTQITTTVPLSAGTGNVTVKVGGETVTGPIFTYQLTNLVTVFAGSGISGSVDGTGKSASFDEPVGIVLDNAGNLFVADQGNNLIRKITPDGVVTTFAGTVTAGFADGVGAAASFSAPSDLVFDNVGNLYVADQVNHRIRKITSGAVVSTFAGSGVYGNTDGVAAVATFRNPNGIAIDGSGNMFVCDPQNGLVRKITGGVVSTFQKNVVSFNSPVGIAIDKSENVYITDVLASKVLEISSSNVVTNLKASANSNIFNGPTAIAIDAGNNVYITDGNLIKKIPPGGVASIFAGSELGTKNTGTPSEVSFSGPSGLAVDAAGNVYVADTFHHIISKIGLQ